MSTTTTILNKPTEENPLRISSEVYRALCDAYGEDLVEEEIKLEVESRELAYNSFMSKLNKAQADGHVAQGTARALAAEALPAYVRGLNDFITKADNGKPGKRHTLLSVFKELEKEHVAFVVLQKIMATCHTPIKVTALAHDLGDILEEEIKFTRVLNTLTPREKSAFLNGLNKRIGMSFKEAFIRAKANRLEEDGRFTKDPWDNAKRINVGLKLIDIFVVSTGMASFRKVGKPKGDYYYNFELAPEMLEWISQNDKELASIVFMNRPMVIPPLNWSTPWNGGYLLNLKRPLCLVRAERGVTRAIYDDVAMPQVYKAVNAIQSTPWRINRRVYEVAKAVAAWKEIPEVLDMPTAEAKEPPMRPAEADTNPEVQKDWRMRMVAYYQQDNKRKSRRFLINNTLGLAETYKDYERIYFPHTLDFRGRVYPVTQLSPQGTDFGKALIEFGDGYRVGATGGRWLAFQLANTFGLDKKPIEERLSWVYENTEFILSTAKDPLNNLEWMSVDSPWEFLAACFEWADYTEQGEDFVSHLPVAFDGSCSGIQHFSAMLHDEIGGRAVNLIPSESVQDIYGIVATEVNRRLEADLVSGTADTMEAAEDGSEYLKKGTKSLAKEWLDYGVTRKVTKRPTMTLSYGAKLYGFKEQVLEDTVYPALEHNPLAFSKASQAANYMATLIWESLGSVVVKAREAMEWLQTASGLLAKTRDVTGKPMPMSWVTPAGFPVRQAYHKYKTKRIRSLLSGAIKVRDVTGEISKENLDEVSLISKEPTEDLDSIKQRNGIAPNFVHSMDASHLMLTVNSCFDQGIRQFAMIHDSYGCPAGQGDIMYATVRSVFVETYTNHNVLQDLHDQIANMLPEKEAKKLPEIPAAGNLDLEVVKDSLYAFA